LKEGSGRGGVLDPAAAGERARKGGRGQAASTIFSMQLMRLPKTRHPNRHRPMDIHIRNIAKLLPRRRRTGSRSRECDRRTGEPSAPNSSQTGRIRLDSVGFTLICPRHRTASKHFQSPVQHPQPDLRGRVVRDLAVAAAAARPMIPNKNGLIYLDSVGFTLTRSQPPRTSPHLRLRVQHPNSAQIGLIYFDSLGLTPSSLLRFSISSLLSAHPPCYLVTLPPPHLPPAQNGFPPRAAIDNASAPIYPPHSHP
jgi:hypothetical protein